jgi:hypothetical protein
MVRRKLVFYRWMPIDGRPPFNYADTLGDLAGKIEADPASAVHQNDEVTTAVNVIAPGS